MIMNTITLSGEQRNFLQQVRQAVFANPFGAERDAVDCRLTRLEPEVFARQHSSDEQISLLIRAVEEQLQQICPAAGKPVACFKGEDRNLVRYGILFHLFHKYCFRFDQHIQQQIKQGNTPCLLGFGRELLTEMDRTGIEGEEAVRYVGLFFQMRRAFYFINQIIGISPCMGALRRGLWNNIFTHDITIYNKYLWNRMEDFSTMLLGATGTGKGLAAASIGRSGYIPYNEKKDCFEDSFTRIFVAINLSQYPEQLLESELFGHKKGAFTGAVEGHEGVFSRCSANGAIFLDEIGEVSTPVQIKLLQVLQDRCFSAVGSHKVERFAGRVIAATNRSLSELRDDKLLRDDFYYRLSSDVIEVPPLCQRIQEDGAEFEQLLNHTVSRIIGEPAPQLAALVGKSIHQQLSADYPWPGNVRELEQCVRRILLNQQYAGDTAASRSSDTGTFDSLLMEGGFTAQQLLARYCGLLYQHLGTYGAVAARTGLDRRTVKKYVEFSG
jgi:hypothetical protein